MNITTLKLIAVGVAGGIFGFVAARIYFHPSSAPYAQHEKSIEPADPAEPEKSAESAESAEPSAPIVSIEQIDTTDLFNNQKKIGHAAFDHKTRDLLL